MEDYIPPVQVAPSYMVTSVDNALRLVQIIRDEGQIAVGQAAARLGVAPSTAHRLLAMLVYRGFALQDEQRRYIAGPALIPTTVSIVRSGELRDTLLPELQRLSLRLGESIHLSVLTGVNIHIIATALGRRPGAVDSREGSVMPAHRTSTGKIILANSDEHTARTLVHRLFQQGEHHGDREPRERERAILHDLALSRARGYALNRDEFEPNITTIGFYLTIPGKPPLAAFCVAAPTFRISEFLKSEMIESLQDSRDALNAILADKFYPAE